MRSSSFFSNTTQRRILSGKAPMAKASRMFSINGLQTPTITMQPGEVQLWRLLNATEGNEFLNGVILRLFQTEGFTFKQTAQDGVQFSPTNYDQQPFLRKDKDQVPGGLVLAGGNRADLLVQAPMTPGVYAFNGTSGGPIMFFVSVAGDVVRPPNGDFPEKEQWAQMPKFLWDLHPPGHDVTNPNSPVKFEWEDGRQTPGKATQRYESLPTPLHDQWQAIRNPPGHRPMYAAEWLAGLGAGKLYDRATPVPHPHQSISGGRDRYT